jgi:hypothetical protein
MIAHRRPVRCCTWHDCAQPAAATVAFELPNLLAGSRRDYCATHTTKVCLVRGAVVVARFGPSQGVLPGLSDAAAERRASCTRSKGVMP